MIIDEQEDRIAVLLSLMGKEVSEPLINQLPEDPRNRVRQLVNEYQNQPLDDEDVDEVIDEFMRMLRVADESSSKVKKETGKKSKKAPPPAPNEADDSDEFEQTDDAIADLLRLEPFQVAGALKAEHPRTMALVLNAIPPVQGGEILQLLPTEVQGEVFLLLKQKPTASPKLLNLVVRSTVEKGCILDDNAMSDPEEETYKNLAELLRAMGKPERSNVMESLQTSDPDAVERLSKLLFIFEDILTLTDRCIQKILGEVDTTTIAKAIKNAEPELQNKFLDNLSKRAKATLMEEMEFMEKIKEEEQIEAEQAICNTMAQLDQAGDLEVIDS